MSLSGLLAISTLLAQASVDGGAARKPTGSSRPTALALPGFRLHVLASEDLPADRLRELAHESAVLWLSTRSNALRDSTLEALARFKESYVRLRAPMLEAHALQLSRAPLAGAWLEVGDLGGAGLHRLGHRRVAIELRAALSEETAERVARWRPTHVIWEAGAEANLSQWAVFRQLPGKKLARLSGAQAALTEAPSSCAVSDAAPALWLDARATFVGLWPLPCGRGGRARIAHDVADDVLRWLYKHDPAIELEVEVNDDERASRGARSLIDRLAEAAPGARSPRR
ncbi:MAG: hypothetical protein HYZ28_08895 [Myxococcales bacterium]|nr:hypothetical protein [Myxococcales bacterium]